MNAAPRRGRGVARTWLQKRGRGSLALLLFALCYYGSYYRHGINFNDEGGTEVLLAQRLLEGERPFRDVVLGYNVLWFYPIVGLFKLFGVSFVVLRVYCFALSTLTAILGFLTVERAGRRPWLAFLTGVLLVLVPGMTFKNYMPLLAVANAFCLLHFALAARPDKERAARRLWLWLAIGGAVLGLTFLIRIDVGLFCGALWSGAIVFTAWQFRRSIKAALALIFGAPALIASLVIGLHLPVYLDAQRRGFAEPFLGQYSDWPKSLTQKVQQVIGKKPAPPFTLPPRAASTPPDRSLATPKPPPANKEILRRKTWRDFTAGKLEDQLLTVLLYLPLVSYVLLIPWALLSLFRTAVGDDPRSTPAPWAPCCCSARRSPPFRSTSSSGRIRRIFPSFRPASGWPSPAVACFSANGGGAGPCASSRSSSSRTPASTSGACSPIAGPAPSPCAKRAPTVSAPKTA